ncbi:MAG: VWA domain-containing protein [Rhizobiaceae bacterium]|jgi:hypothetical protein|nr:VWA domain-containing protein [Rhizobiaceae bacterium]
MSSKDIKTSGTQHVAGPARPTTDVAAFIAAAKAAPAPGSGRLILALDATMSRQPTWDMACSLQAEMFAAAGRKAGLAVQLVYFRGHGESRASKFVTDTRELARLMTGVTCAGGLTQIGKVFNHALTTHAKAKVSALVFIGDAFEEPVDEVADLAGRMGLNGIPAFIFQEGHDTKAEIALKECARLSGGAWFRFDRAAPGKLAELLNAIAVYASAGRVALAADTSAGARLLLSSMPGGPRT